MFFKAAKTSKFYNYFFVIYFEILSFFQKKTQQTIESYFYILNLALFTTFDKMATADFVKGVAASLLTSGGLFAAFYAGDLHGKEF